MIPLIYTYRNIYTKKQKQIQSDTKIELVDNDIKNIFHMFTDVEESISMREMKEIQLKTTN